MQINEIAHTMKQLQLHDCDDDCLIDETAANEQEYSMPYTAGAHISCACILEMSNDSM